MKATILTDGTLKITPENELESWALRQWWGDGDMPNPLHAAFFEIEPPAEAQEAQP